MVGEVKRFRKKPVEIEAIRWDGEPETYLAVKAWAGSRSVGMNRKGELLIRTPEGIMKANVGDWIIKGVKGEIYPCKPKIFEETYEEV